MEFWIGLGLGGYVGRWIGDEVAFEAPEFNLLYHCLLLDRFGWETVGGGGRMKCTLGLVHHSHNQTTKLV